LRRLQFHNGEWSTSTAIAKDIEPATVIRRITEVVIESLITRNPARERFGLHLAKQLHFERHTMAALALPLVFAAVQYSIIYLLLGGGFFGAFIIFIVAKMLGR